MLVKIEEIQEPGLELKEPIRAEVLTEALADSEGFSFVSSTALKVSFKRVSGRVHVRGGFEATVEAPCKRCLRGVRLEVPVEFALRMVPDQPAPDPEEGDDDPRRHRARGHDEGEGASFGSFELDEVDAEPFDGKTIDLDPIVREQVLLALPVSVVCREDCRGLCSACGQDLNDKDCGHVGQKEVDVRLAKLKDIKLKN